MGLELELNIAKPLLGPARAPRRRPAWLPAVLAVVWVIGTAGLVRAADEYSVKAALMVKFAQTYLKWPASAFAAADSPISIGVLGDDPFGGKLEEAAAGVEVGSEKRKVMIKRSHQVADLKACHMVFVSKSEKDRVPQIVLGLAGNTLTLGETDGFTKQGGMINFYVANEKVRFEINNDAAIRHGITISSDLIAASKPAH